MENKKAQGLSVQTIILIILGIVVLVVLIIGFTAGWGNIKEWIAPSNNVDDVVSQCNIACGTESKYDFCSAERDLKSENLDTPLEDVTCYGLAIKKTEYGIAECPTVDCGIAPNKEVTNFLCEKDQDKISYLDVNGKPLEYTCVADDVTGAYAAQTICSDTGEVACTTDKCLPTSATTPTGTTPAFPSGFECCSRAECSLY